MNFYLTYGTFDFLEKLKEKYSEEKMLLLSSNENACLLHESAKKTKFQSPKKFVEIVAIGDYHDASIAAFTYIPVSLEGEPIIEYLFKKNEHTKKWSYGFIALRALKPIKSETYLVISFWNNMVDCQNWIQAINNQTIPDDHFLSGIEQLSHGLSKRPYSVIYSIS